MLLKFISTNDLNIRKSFDIGFKKIQKLPKFERYMTYFWILGPMLYLLERDPADLWLTSISFIFLVRCIIKKEWSWSGQLWFIFAILLWLTSMVSAFFGPYTEFTFFQGFAWIRFPLYVAAAQIWLGKDYDVRMVMFVSIFIGMIIMCFILICELLVEGPKKRLMWPYGDLVPGSYLTKISLPVYCTLIVTVIYNFNKNIIFSFISVFLSLSMVFATGERGNFLIRFLSGFLAIFSWKLKFKNIFKFFLLLLIFFLITIFSFSKTNKDLLNRYTMDFYKSLPVINMSETNYYWGAWRSGIHQGLSHPLIGLGPSSLRKHCKNIGIDKKTGLPIYKLFSPDIKWLPGKNYCGNHPHNFYIQLFAETGIVGLILGTLMFYFLFLTCYRGRAINPNCIITSVAYIIPFAFFFPIQQTGSFFGQWGNLFIWFPIGFCIAQIQDYKSIFKK